MHSLCSLQHATEPQFPDAHRPQLWSGLALPVGGEGQCGCTGCLGCGSWATPAGSYSSRLPCKKKPVFPSAQSVTMRTDVTLTPLCSEHLATEGVQDEAESHLVTEYFMAISFSPETKTQNHRMLYSDGEHRTCVHSLRDGGCCALPTPKLWVLGNTRKSSADLHEETRVGV